GTGKLLLSSSVLLIYPIRSYFRIMHDGRVELERPTLGRLGFRLVAHNKFVSIRSVLSTSVKASSTMPFCHCIQTIV
ncbi:hypothetical protein VIGAN_03231100, partial [Vigna angularis var. angularis]